MKKITSLMMLLVLFCTGAFAQATEYENKSIKVGTVQAEMVPGQWYFVHTPRNPNQSAEAFGRPGDNIQASGGLVYDNGSRAKVSSTNAIELLSTEEGAISDDYIPALVRFVADPDGGYNIQFGNGRWMGSNPNTTITNNQYVAGEAGAYNFYLIKLNGEPNDAGRFGWNKFDMGSLVDNNGAGNDVVFWSEGERTAAEGTTSGDEIIGNNVWQIYDIQITGDVDLYDKYWNALVALYNEINARNEYTFIDGLRAGENVGSSYGNYRTENVEAFLALFNQMDEAQLLIDANEKQPTDYWPTAEELQAFYEALEDAIDAVDNNKIPLAVNDIAAGYYTINSMQAFTVAKNDTIYYTQEECDELNAINGVEPGAEGYLTTDSVKEVDNTPVPSPIKSLRSLDYNGEGWLAWSSLEQTAEFLWKIEKVEGRPTEYRLTNMYRGQTIGVIPQSANFKLIENDTMTVVFDYMGVKAKPVTEGVETPDETTAYCIRAAYGTTEGGYNYAHCGGHNNGTGTGAWIVGWTTSLATQWYLSPVDEATANAWMDSDEAKYKKMVAAADAIAATAPAQIEIAKDIKVEVLEGTEQISDASQLNGNATIIDGNNGLETAPTSADETYALLIDGNHDTFWHTDWAPGAVAGNSHYLQVSTPEALNGNYTVQVVRRNAANDHPIVITVKAYAEDNAELGFEDGVEVGVLQIPYSGAGETDLATNYFEGKGYSIFRFYATECTGSNYGTRGYWHSAEFQVLECKVGTVHEKTQYEVRKEIITRLEAAIAAWNAGEYTIETPEKYGDATFQAVYKELTEAAAAWEAVYVNPADLRETINNAPAADLFVVGNNPGEWASAEAAPTSTINNANSYDASGAYTPAESEKWIKAIEDAVAGAYAAANPVKENKWYRLQFPTEEAYDKYGWDKAGAQAVEHEDYGTETSHALFGKTIAAGKLVNEYDPQVNEEGNGDTLTVYNAESVEDIYAGNHMMFFEDGEYEDGQDLFRFIQATDTSYIIQHKSGLFLRGGMPASLNAIPSYFSTRAIGAGASIITYTNVVGDEVQHCNLHGERSTNRLTTWEADDLGTNSALLIKEVEDVTEAPANTFQAQFWPGNTNAYTYPVDIKILSGAQAYGAKLDINENDTTVVLMTLTDETIKAGTPFILVADCDGEYISYDDRYNEIKAEFTATSWSLFDKQEANNLIGEEYAIVEMEHGMKVDTVLNDYCDLVGTMRNVEIEAGKAIVTKDNGFRHTLTPITIGANSAYVASDFDGESPDVLATIKVKIEGEITRIEDVLNAVSKSGNIYTIDGKLVGKGNINNINNMPAGIYVVNGVKMIKK